MLSNHGSYMIRVMLTFTLYWACTATPAPGQQCPPNPSTSPALIVTVDGMKLLGLIPLPQDFTDEPPYLPAALASMDISVPNDHIVPFLWSRDPDDTEAVIPQLQDFLIQQYTCAQAAGQKFIIVSHSWGTFLTHIALSRAASSPSHVVPDLYITLGAPLGVLCSPRCDGTCFADSDNCLSACELEVPIVDYVGIKLLQNSFFPLSPDLYPDTGRWVNYWAWGDSFSGPLDALPQHAGRALPEDIQVDSSNDYPCYFEWIGPTAKWHKYDSLQPGGSIDNQPLLDTVQALIEQVISPVLVREGTSVQPNAAQPGAQITVRYAVSNFKPDPIDLFLGASIRPVSGGGFINSLDCEGCASDALVTIAGDADQLFTRCFTIPQTAQPGQYEVCYAIWSPANCGPGNQYDSFCRSDLTVLPPPPDGCEPNETFESSCWLGNLTQPLILWNMSIGSNDKDWYSFYMSQTGTANNFVGIDFQHSQGDLNMCLWKRVSINPLVIQSQECSEGLSNEELISLANRSSGVYYIQVYGQNGATNPNYTLCIIPPSDICQPGNHLSKNGDNWDDSAARSNCADGIMEAGENVSMKVRLLTSVDVTDLDAVLSTSDRSINITQATAYYDNFLANDTQWATGWFEMQLDFILPQGDTRVSNFTMHVTYNQDGHPYCQDIHFTKTFYPTPDPCLGNVSLDHVTWLDGNVGSDGNGNNQAESGEFGEFDIYVANTGPVEALDCQVCVTNSNIAGISDACHPYPPLLPGNPPSPTSAIWPWRITGDSIPKNFTGWVTADITISCPGLDDVTYSNQHLFEVNPLPWVSESPRNIDFGRVAPGDPLQLTATINSNGSAPAHITNIVTTCPSTTILEWVGTPWVLAPGESRSITIQMDTTGMDGPVSCEVIVDSDGGLFASDHDIISVTGYVTRCEPTNIAFSGSVESPDISGTHLVWQAFEGGDADVYLYDTVTRVVTQITDDPVPQTRPRISDNLICWDDERNDSGSDPINHDVYSYDVETHQESPVVDSAADERFLGVDGNIVAFFKHDFSYSSYGRERHGYNLYYKDLSHGTTEQVTFNGVPSPGSPLFSADAPTGDIDSGLIIWETEEHAWVSAAHGWDNSFQVRLMKFKIGVDSSPVQIYDGFTRAFATSGGEQVVWSQDTSSGRAQVFLWGNGTIHELTSGDCDQGYVALGFGAGRFAYYSKAGGDCSPGWLAYRDLVNATESCLSDVVTRANFGSLRGDNNGVVWQTSDTIYFTYIQQSDIAVSSSDLVVSNDHPIERELLDVSILVRNVTEYDCQSAITVRLYDGDPDAGGTPIGRDLTLTGGLTGLGEETITFDDIVVPDMVAAGPETQEFYVRVFVDGYDNPTNNTANGSIIVSDNDTTGPVISNVTMEENSGDAQLGIGSDEEVLVSWSLGDPSGIGEARLYVDGTLVDPLDGDYFAILDPLPAGEHEIRITAVDADNTPSVSEYTDIITIASAEEIRVTYDGHPVPNGNLTPLDLGTFHVGSPSSAAVFVVQNVGEQILTLGALDVSAGLSALPPPVTDLAPGNVTFFTLNVDANSLGSFTGNVSLGNSDEQFTFLVDWRVKNAPTISHVDPLAGGLMNAPLAITWTAMDLASDAQDGDGNPADFLVEAVSNGSLMKNGQPVSARETVLAPGESLLWTPPVDTFGLIEAFLVRAWDDGLTSTDVVRVSVDVSECAPPPTWCRDADGDGFGTSGDSLTNCNQPAGYVLDCTDCDDSDPLINPEGVDQCDLDRNCDGVSPESRSWYGDADGDGCGDSNDTKQSCDQPSGYVSNSDDGCPNDPNKTSPGTCGCGTPDTDTDGDGTPDCIDHCPNDPNKIDAGTCGCGSPDTDTDGDGTPDCNDPCPYDPANICHFGACCLTDGSCEEMKTQDDCTAVGGIYRGDGVDCASTPCITGACCIGGDTCSLDMTEADCTSQGGVWQGEGSASCIDCTPTGACDLSDRSCIVTTRVECSSQGGTYQGDNVPCCQMRLCGMCLIPASLGIIAGLGGMRFRRRRRRRLKR